MKILASTVLNCMKSIRAFIDDFNALNLPLNLLINNAGIMFCPYQLSEDGIEVQFAANHIGHFLQTNLLLDKMKNTAKATGIEGRIVNLSSIAHLHTYEKGIQFNMINDPARDPSDVHMKSASQGAVTTCHVALHPTLKGVTCKYFLDYNDMEPSAFARYEILAKKLWSFSQKQFDSASKA